MQGCCSHRSSAISNASTPLPIYIRCLQLLCTLPEVNYTSHPRPVDQRVTIGTSRELPVGQSCFAIGNPYGYENALNYRGSLAPHHFHGIEGQRIATRHQSKQYEAPQIEKDDKSFAESPPEKDMTTSSQHSFGTTEDGFSIRIIENMKEEYGLFVWPSSIILAEYVWQQKSRFLGANVVELGAGTSLPGLVAAKVGADVTLTDDSNRSEVLKNMRMLCNINDLKCRVLGLSWGVWDAPLFGLHPNIILGADVLYDATAFDDLFATVTFLLEKSPDSVFITTYHNRSGHHLIEFLMEKWCLKCVKLVDGFSFLPSHKASNLSGNIQLVELVLDAKQKMVKQRL